MPAYFRVVAPAAFERSMKRLERAGVVSVFESMLVALAEDPFNTSRRHDIKKLSNVGPGEGQWRIRSGVYRLRYDIEGYTVVLYSIYHRKDAY